MKKVLVLIVALALLLGCAGFAGAEETKPVILMVSFGTSYNDSREITIGAIEEDVQAAYPDWEVRRAFTAQTVIDILDKRDGLKIDNVVEAMEAGAAALLIDEDTSATNFMVRDELMQRVIHRDMEPITPFIERMRDLYENQGISTILVAGSSGASSGLW